MEEVMNQQAASVRIIFCLHLVTILIYTTCFHPCEHIVGLNANG